MILRKAFLTFGTGQNIYNLNFNTKGEVNFISFFDRFCRRLIFRKEIWERKWNLNLIFTGNLPYGINKRGRKTVRIDLESPIGKNGGFKLGKQV
jgi:hypothetical protein